MNNYTILFFGMLLGQLISTALIVYILQKQKNIAYFPALKAYVIGEQGSYIIAAIGLLITMFLLPDIIDPEKQIGMSESIWKCKLKVASNFRVFSIIWGVFSPLILLLAFKKGIKAIHLEDKKNNDSVT